MRHVRVGDGGVQDSTESDRKCEYNYFVYSTLIANIFKNTCQDKKIIFIY